MKVNSEAIYASKYWKYQNDSLNDNSVWYTQVNPSIEYMTISQTGLNGIFPPYKINIASLNFSQKMPNQSTQSVWNGLRTEEP